MRNTDRRVAPEPRLLPSSTTIPALAQIGAPRRTPTALLVRTPPCIRAGADRRVAPEPRLMPNSTTIPALARSGIATAASRLRPHRASAALASLARSGIAAPRPHGSARQNTALHPRWRGSAR
ncbi:MAG: hypothetical protein ABI895_35730, partial [Deltaproteobacteria bacterium]